MKPHLIIIFVAVVYGQGCYFANTSQYSMGYSTDGGEKYMIMAKVATGNYRVGDKHVTRANLGERVHSTVNNTSNPSIFVVYHDAAAYPEYVIKFSKLDQGVDSSTSAYQSVPASQPTSYSRPSAYASSSYASYNPSPSSYRSASANLAGASSSYMNYTSSSTPYSSSTSNLTRASSTNRSPSATSSNVGSGASRSGPSNDKKCVIM